MHFFRNWFNRIFSISNPIVCDEVGSSQNGDNTMFSSQWSKSFQVLWSALNTVFELCYAAWSQYYPIAQSSVHSYAPLEVLPDYYVNCDSAKRLWQDWRVLRRLFIRRDHSRDLLLQGQSGWLPIHGMLVNRQTLTITTDEGEKVLDLEERVVWLSRANPANTQITREPTWDKTYQTKPMWCPA